MSGTVLLFLRFVSAAALYTFLLWGFYILWIEIRSQSQKVAGQKISSIKITTQYRDAPPAAYRYHDPEIFIGRDSACECTLPDDEAVSSQHARISFHHGQWWVEDLDSTNGTKLNNELLQTPTVITVGDKIQCGHSVLIVEWD